MNRHGFGGMLSVAVLVLLAGPAAAPAQECPPSALFVSPIPLLGKDPGSRAMRFTRLPTGLEVTVGTTCQPTAARVSARRVTKIRTGFFDCSSDVVSRPIKFTARIKDPSVCRDLRGALVVGRKLRVPEKFRAEPSRCGDRFTDPGSSEECDDGTDNSDVRPNACRINCVRAHCGDRVVDTGEACDDGDPADDDGCSLNCTLPACGNGVVDASLGETCDDGNLVDDDGCDSNCTATGCGNGIRTGDEKCDDGDGNSFAPNACRPNCMLPRCGDGIVDSAPGSDGVGEQCDDQNDDIGDGCHCCYTIPAGSPVATPCRQCHTGNALPALPPVDPGVPADCKPQSPTANGD